MNEVLKRGTRVMISKNAKVPVQFKGKIGYISKTNYSSDKGCLYHIVGIGEAYDINPSLCDLVATENDIIVIND